MNKKLALAIIALGVIGQTFGQQESVLAKVQKIQGKEVYVLNTPIRSFEVVGTIKTGPKWGSILTRGIINEHVNDKATQFVNRANKKARKDNISFDALYYQEGKQISLIKFSDDGNQLNNGVAEVRTINGIKSYILAEPMSSYEVMEVVKGGVKILPFLTNGFVNNSIEKDVNGLTKRVSKDKELADYSVVYQSGRKAALVTFK